MMIIGITGTLGAGKGTIVDFLLKDYKFTHYSVRSYLQAQMKLRAMPDNRDSMTALANELREQHSPAYIIEQLYEQASKEGKNAVIESIRTPGEAQALKNLKGNAFFYLIAVDAPQSVRYERIQKRASSTDHISFSTFCANEAREMQNEEPYKQNLQKCIAMADVRFDNSGSIDELKSQLKAFMEKCV